MSLYVKDVDLELHQGDALEVLRTLPDESVHMCATSPPFFGLRDYGTGKWEGGDAGCDHLAGIPNRDHSGAEALGTRGKQGAGGASAPPSKSVCRKCGATRIDQQIGLENSPEEWVAKLVEVFREVRRILRADGTLWVEVGDSYARNGGEGGHGPNAQVGNTRSGQQRRMLKVPEEARGGRGLADNELASAESRCASSGSLKPKDLVGAPWMLAFALRADGWYLRSEIIWHKLNAMPESVQDRPTTAHSRIFLLSRKARYYYDAEALREPHSPDGRAVTGVKGQDGSIQHRDGERWPGTGRNSRSVWPMPTESFSEAHFATYPQELVRRCILAGSSAKGCCPECGAPWVREVEVSHTEAGRGNNNMARKGAESDALTARPYETRMLKSTETTGWHPSCECGEYVCPVCDNDLEDGSSTKAVSGVRGSVRAERPPQEAEVLLSGVRERGQADASAEGVRGLRSDVPTIEAGNALLLEGVREPMVGSDSSDDEGLCSSGEGLHLDPSAKASDGESGRLRHGTPPGDGRTPGALAYAGGSRPPHQRREGRQPARESDRDGESGARPSAQEAAHDNRVSALRRDDPDIKRCPRCDDQLERVPLSPVPSRVLDCFSGAGTTALVARKHGRRSLMIELSSAYCEMQAKRLQQLSLLSEVGT